MKNIERITNEAYDERFYKHPQRKNVRTGNNFFPAYHFLMSLGAPASVGLNRWRQDKGHFADYLLTRSAEIGSYVHDVIDKMIKLNVDFAQSDIEQIFEDEKEAEKVKQ